MAGYSIEKDSFALIPNGIATVSEMFTLSAEGWENNAQTASVPLEFFYINTVNVPPEELGKWGEYGIYPSKENISHNSITFSCNSAPSQDLHFTVTRIAASAIGDFSGSGNTLDAYTGSGSDIVIPDGIAAISDKAFSGKEITSVLVPFRSLTIGDYAFANCTEMVSFKGDTSGIWGPPPDVVLFDKIGMYAFANCTSLEAIVLDSVGHKVIADYAFKDCTGLTSITLSEYVGTKNAFDGCTNVEEINVIAVIAWNADFSFTDKLTAECLSDMIDQLYDYSGGEAHTLTIGATNRSRLTAEQIAAASAKNWTIV